jgi:methyl-accepting chemotaxis protein
MRAWDWVRGIRLKMLGLVALGVVSVAAVSANSLNTLWDVMLADRKQTLQAATGVLHSRIGAIKTSLDRGAITESEARDRLTELIHTARYNGTSYFGLYNLAGIMLAHGTTSAFDGADMLHHKNPTVRNNTRVMLDLCAGGRSGFISVLGSKSGQPNVDVEKLYYAASFVPWDLVTVASSELDDIQLAFWNAASRGALISLGVAALLLVAGLWIGQNVSGGIKDLDRKMRRLADGGLDIDLSLALGRRDEISAMARAVGVFKVNAIERFRLVGEQAERERQAAEERQAAHLSAEREIARGEELRHLEQFADAAFEGLVLHREGTILYANAALATLLGCARVATSLSS